MNSSYLYLLIDISAIAIPLAASFQKKHNFFKKWKNVWISIFLSGLIFLLWDGGFTRLGVWGFNPKYLSGIYIGMLPLEEILFFICIPYACLFTYFAVTHLIEKDYLFPHQELISSALSIILLISGVFNLERWYTGITFTGLGFALGLQMLYLRPRYMGRFYLSFLFTLFPFLLVNGILTGFMIPDEVVWYNDEENLGIRIGTIPFEDVFYGLLLVLSNVIIFEYLEEKDRYKKLLKDEKKS